MDADSSASTPSISVGSSWPSWIPTSASVPRMSRCRMPALPNASAIARCLDASDEVRPLGGLDLKPDAELSERVPVDVDDGLPESALHDDCIGHDRLAEPRLPGLRLAAERDVRRALELLRESLVEVGP